MIHASSSKYIEYCFRGHVLWLGLVGSDRLLPRGRISWRTRAPHRSIRENPSLKELRPNGQDLEQADGPSGGSSARPEAAAPITPASEKIDARFGTNEVERQLRVALRTAQERRPGGRREYA